MSEHLFLDYHKTLKAYCVVPFGCLWPDTKIWRSRCVRCHRENVGTVLHSTTEESAAPCYCGDQGCQVLYRNRWRQTPSLTGHSGVEKLLDPPRPWPPRRAGLLERRQRRPRPSKGHPAAPDTHRVPFYPFLPSVRHYSIKNTYAHGI